MLPARRRDPGVSVKQGNLRGEHPAVGRQARRPGATRPRDTSLLTEGYMRVLSCDMRLVLRCHDVRNSEALYPMAGLGT